LRLDGGDPNGPARQRLITVIRQGALDRVERHGPAGLARGVVFGSPSSELAIRRYLEASFRSLATQAATVNEHGILIDRANEVRPWSRR
jgi:serine/threonine-protein kinase PknG